VLIKPFFLENVGYKSMPVFVPMIVTRYKKLRINILRTSAGRSNEQRKKIDEIDAFSL